jgi:hypothetical protein
LVKYRLPRQSHADRYQPDRLGRDGQGPFMWVTDVNVGAHQTAALNTCDSSLPDLAQPYELGVGAKRDHLPGASTTP